MISPGGRRWPCSWTGSRRTIRCGRSRPRREISIGATQRPGSTACRGCKAGCLITPAEAWISTLTGRALLPSDPEQPGHDHARHESPDRHALDCGRAVAARHRCPVYAGGVVGHDALRRHPHDAARRHADYRLLYADWRVTPVSAHARWRGQDHGCQHCHPGRYLRRHRDTGTLWSIDPVSAPDRGRDQRPVRTIHFLTAAVGISFPVRAVLRCHFSRCDPDANSVRRRGRTD